MDLPDLDESGTYTFETEESTQLKSWEYEPSDHSEIDESLPPRDEVIESIVTSRELVSGDNLDGRIARLSQEIEDLKSQVGDAPVRTVEDKLDELKAKKKFTLYNQQEFVSPKIDRTSLESLYGVEKRITVLEDKIGPQQEPVALLKLIQQTKQKIDLLAMNPQQIEQSVEALTKAQVQVPVDKVSAVYNRLSSLGPLLDQLPQITERLKSLELLHLDTTASQGFLKDAEGTLRQIQSDIVNWNKRLDKMEQMLAEQ